MRIDPPPIERPPPPIRSENQVRDEDMRMQLRIASPRSPMPEGRGDQPTSADRHCPAGTTPSHRGHALDIRERLEHCLIVRALNRGARLVIANAEQHAHALRSRERQVKPRHPPRDHPPKRLTARRSAPAQHPVELQRIDRPVEPERPGPVTNPHPRSLRAAKVVILDARGHRARARHAATRLLQGVVGLANSELSDRQHG
jgi:hypothetical protein